MSYYDLIFRKKSFLIFIMICVIYNLVKFNNYIFLTVVLFGVFLFFYKDPNILDRTSNLKRKVHEVINSFDDIKDMTFDSFAVYRIPKTYKYLFIKPTILQNLVDLQFVRQFDQASYIKIFVLMETFLRIFYKTIIGRMDIQQTLSTLIQIHEEMSAIRDVLKLNVPIVSKNIKRFKDDTLHEVIEHNMKHILEFLADKIKIAKSSLIE